MQSKKTLSFFLSIQNLTNLFVPVRVSGGLVEQMITPDLCKSFIKVQIT